MIEPLTASAENPSPATQASRRTTPRFECRHVTFYKPVSDRGREAELATVQDISLLGIGLLVRERIKPGTILTIELNSTMRCLQHEFLARVAHVTEQGDGRVLLGCEFATRLTEKDLRAFMR